MNLNYRNIIIILYNPEILKYIQIKDSLVETTDLKVVLTGLVFI